MFMSRNLIYGGPQKPFANRKARVIFFSAPVYRIGCKNVRGWPVGKVWRKRHPGLLFPGLVAQGGLTGVLLPLGHHCVSRSLPSPLDKARACPPPSQALVPATRRHPPFRPAGGSTRPDWGRALAASASQAITNFLPVAFPSLLLGRGRRQIPRQRRRRGRAAGPGALIKPCGSPRPLCWSCGTRAPRGGGTCPHSTPVPG